MAIRFTCICGHHLKARDEMAGRRTMCPACGAPVGIPSLEPTHRGTEPLPSDLTRRTMIRPNPLQAATKTGLSNAPCSPTVSGFQWPQGEAKHVPDQATCWREAACSVRLVTGQERRARWRKPRVWDFETRWYQCLKYPARELPMLLALAAALATASSVALVVLPRVLQTNLVRESLSPLIIILCLWAIVPVLVVGHACLFLSRVLHYAASGQVKYAGWPEPDRWPPLVSLGQWSGCFLSGPVLAAGAGVYYWLQCGAMGPLDWLILAELLCPAVGYWLVALLVASQTERLVDVHPVRVFTVVGRLGGHALAAAALGSSVLLIDLWFGMYAIEQLHRNWMWGTLVLGLCWFSALYGGTFVLRLLGLWYFRFGRQTRPAARPLWAIPGLALTPSAAIRTSDSRAP